MGGKIEQYHLVRDASGNQRWALDLKGELDGVAGATGTFRVDTIFVIVSGVDRIEARLPHPIDMPAPLLHPSEKRFRTSQELEQILEADARLRHEVREAIRRLGTQEIRWRNGAFARLPKWYGANHALAAEFAGEAKLNLAPVLLDPNDAAGSETVFAEFAARGSVKAEIENAGFALRAVVLVVRLRKADVPTLRLDLDDFNLGLPEFKFPALDLLGPLDLGLYDLTALTVSLPALGRLLSGVTPSVTGPDTSNVRLLIDATKDPVPW